MMHRSAIVPPRQIVASRASRYPKRLHETTISSPHAPVLLLLIRGRLRCETCFPLIHVNEIGLERGPRNAW
jgi:hypothetical protein